ncbi:helix-turn-helix transcriptional regulator [Agromyces sp. H66]|uniref:helix-turn-helix domain-containing transcriptional regulator n=1 Tax=Agromyces sp. H66 TaxID=2529859 RepID=UPI0010AA183C|nr:helix-turn-helix transcriptional regulator [Agromyces sp. H66]
MSRATEVFWEDLREDLKDPEFLREYVSSWVRITTTDTIINELDDVRVEAGISKAELARAINADPASLRRLFSATRSNPTLGTLAEIAAALGMRITLEPLDQEGLATTTRPLLDGATADPSGLVSRLGATTLV